MLFVACGISKNTKLLSGMNEEMAFFGGTETSGLPGISGHYPAAFVPIHKFLGV